MYVCVLWASGSSDLSPILAAAAATRADNLCPEPHPRTNTARQSGAPYIPHTDTIDNTHRGDIKQCRCGNGVKAVF